jgi:ankyrin repeat protein
VHKAIIANDLTVLRSLIHQVDKMQGKITPEVMAYLEQRNKEGQTAFFAAVANNSLQIAEFLMDEYPGLDFFAKDTLAGDTAFHVACRNQNIELAAKIFALRPEKCLAPNFKGQSPFLIATQVQSMQLLELFAEFKYQSLSCKDRFGENPLFECARNGNEEIFNWFAGNNEFYKARGQQNYKGQTIEHIVCLHKQFELVDEIRPRLDTTDYYGSLPLYYSLQQDDVKMIEKFFSN